jgi:hypothetical protein
VGFRRSRPNMLRIPSDADQRSDLMAIAIPKSCRSAFQSEGDQRSKRSGSAGWRRRRWATRRQLDSTGRGGSRLPQERLSMQKIKTILRLASLGFSQRQIATSRQVGQATVSDYLRMAAQAGLQWPTIADWDDDRIEAALVPTSAPAPHWRNSEDPDYAAIRCEVQNHKQLTLQLLWQEYPATPAGFESQYSSRNSPRWTWRYHQENLPSKAEKALRVGQRARGLLRFGVVQTDDCSAACILDLWNTLVVAVGAPWPGDRGPLRRGRSRSVARRGQVHESSKGRMAYLNGEKEASGCCPINHRPGIRSARNPVVDCGKRREL